MGFVPDWRNLAACRNGDPDALFVKGAEQNVAKRICRGCPVRYECLTYALDNRMEFGVWGGMTERERRALLRKNPNVVSWGSTIEAAIGLVGDEQPVRQACQQKVAPPAGSAALASAAPGVDEVIRFDQEPPSLLVATHQPSDVGALG